MALAEKIYKRSLVKYQNGVISSLELTQAQNQFLTSQTTYYQSILTLISEKNKLEKLTTKN
jgi:outer membrane protein